ncbi:hypothetical protein H6F96_14850 [Microcoleus sp. FACHB-53]|nr:hypothetical protein [Microcoleus sp. FACHB-53]
MPNPFTVNGIDWTPILCRIRVEDDQDLPKYPGNLKVALLKHAGLTDHPKADEAYQTAVDIARLTTVSDPEIVYWFSRIAPLMTQAKDERRVTSSTSWFSR